VRDHYASRLEAFSDAVFAFALTLLVVSLEVPSSYGDLTETMRGFLPFACTFAIVTWIWWEHNVFFRNFPLEGPYTVFLNGVLLFLVLLYVYPLKFMATVVFAMFGVVSREGLRIQASQIPSLLAIYSGGFVVLFVAFALLYHHAWQRREALGLDPIAAFEARAGIVAHLLSASIGALSVAIAMTLPTRWAWLAGPFYFIMGPIHYWWGARVARVKSEMRATPAAALAD
jgi:uncharacterized membrane protein